MGKAFEKRIKNNRRARGKKQVKALKDSKPKKLEATESKSVDKLSIQEKIFNKLLDERMDEIQQISKETDLNNLTYYFKGPNLALINFIGFTGPLNIYKEIQNSNISIKKGEEDQKKFKSNLNDITSGNPTHREKYQSDAVENIRDLYNSRQKIIDLFNYYAM